MIDPSPLETVQLMPALPPAPPPGSPFGPVWPVVTWLVAAVLFWAGCLRPVGVLAVAKIGRDAHAMNLPDGWDRLAAVIVYDGLAVLAGGVLLFLGLVLAVRLFLELTRTVWNLNVATAHDRPAPRRKKLTLAQVRAGRK